jgi:lipid II:glycine glycyltransferase (peptidoglycan interpeptide bridge formation enzyme)
MSFSEVMAGIGLAFKKIGKLLEPFVMSFLKKEAVAALNLAITIVPQVAKTLANADGSIKNAEAKKQILKGLAKQGIKSIQKSTLDNAIQVAGEATGVFSNKLISTTTGK